MKTDGTCWSGALGHGLYPPMIVSRIYLRKMTGDLILRKSVSSYIIHFRQGSLIGCSSGGVVMDAPLAPAVRDVFSWGEGWFSFLVPMGEQTLEAAEKPDTATLILNGVREIENLNLVEEALGRSEGQIRPVETLPEKTAFEYSLVESFLLSRMEGPFTVDELCQLSPVTRPETLRGIYVLLCAGMVTGNADPLQQEYAAMASPAEEGILGAVRSLSDLGPTKPPASREPSFYRGPQQPVPDLVSIGVPSASTPRETAAAVSVELLPQPEVSEGMDERGCEDPMEMARYHFEKGLEHFTNEDYHGAIQLFRLAVKIDDEQAEYHRHLALALSRNPMWGRKAEQALLRAVELDPGHAETHYFLGRIYLDAGLPRRARERFKESLRIKPDLEPARLELTVMKGKAPAAEKEPVPVTLFDGN